MTATIATIDPLELNALVQRGYSIDLIDVRTPVEFREVHATPARNIPLDRLDPSAVSADRGETSEPVYFICRSDARGKKACEACVDAGLENVVNVAGGTLAWADLGLPVVRGKKAVSLDRQVRIAAGSLVMISIALSLLWHPGWIGLSAFVGAGLVFAGVTDTCGMGMLLAKMPWNQRTSASCTVNPKETADNA